MFNNIILDFRFSFRYKLNRPWK